MALSDIHKDDTVNNTDQEHSSEDNDVISQTTAHAAHSTQLHGLASLAQEDFSVMDAIGGIRGVVESLLPGLVFVIGFVTTRNLGLTIIVAAALAGLELILRLVQRQSIMGALSGVAAVGICLVWAWFSNDARNYYLPGFITNACWIVVLLLSIAVRIPGIGALVEFIRNPAVTQLSTWLNAWRSDKPLYRAYTKVTFLWCAIFALRLAIQLPLYVTEQIAYLGTARLVMGIPLFALTIWLSWLMLATPLHIHRRSEEQAEIQETDIVKRRTDESSVDDK